MCLVVDDLIVFFRCVWWLNCGWWFLYVFKIFLLKPWFVLLCLRHFSSLGNLCWYLCAFSPSLGWGFLTCFLFIIFLKMRRPQVNPRLTTNQRLTFCLAKRPCLAPRLLRLVGYTLALEDQKQLVAQVKPAGSSWGTFEDVNQKHPKTYTGDNMEGADNIPQITCTLLAGAYLKYMKHAKKVSMYVCMYSDLYMRGTTNFVKRVVCKGKL